MSLCHALHYCYSQGWLIVHVPDAHLWVKNCKELLPSSSRPSRFDQPIQASQWLKNFKITNERFLSKFLVNCIFNHLISFEQGVNRMKSSSDVVGAVLRELRLQAGGATEGEGAFKLAVAVDGVNALWGKTSLKKEDRTMSGGAILTALSQTGSVFKPRSAYLPSELLGEEGFDNMEPFVPVSVSNYNEKEFESCYLYYLDRNWLQHPHSRSEEGKKELIFLSNKNPSILERLCAFL
ncbi:hypothetical protein cypCar_00031587 [Cyprinus carpio]|nr:hypothetical protein cypCar_00031587 [Cyprinus carpio]